MRLPLLLLLTASLGLAQGSLPLTMKRAVEIALAPDGSTRAALAQESIQLAQDRVAEAKAALLPNLDTSVQYRRQTTNLQSFGFNFKIPVPGFSIPAIVGPFSVLDTRAAAQQSVVNISDIRKFQAAKATLSAVKLDNDATRGQVSDEVARGYLACLRADADRNTGRANVELSEALLAQAKRAQTAGTGTGIEVTRAEVQLANDRQRLIRSENDRTRATLQLLKSMGLRMDSSIEFTDKLDYKPIDPASAETLLEQAHKTRFEMKSQQQHEEAARLS
ncbi:MAG: TolC family protein, partial [Acidobacteriota bacterium]|nr:TolC family protein [Acidobacteriota bacterium]